jgi:hypothetical protein
MKLLPGKDKQTVLRNFESLMKAGYNGGDSADMVSERAVQSYEGKLSAYRKNKIQQHHCRWFSAYYKSEEGKTFMLNVEKAKEKIRKKAIKALTKKVV